MTLLFCNAKYLFCVSAWRNLRARQRILQATIRLRVSPLPAGGEQGPDILRDLSGRSRDSCASEDVGDERPN